MKKWILGILILSIGMSVPVNAKEEPKGLYARSAAIMDAETGRVLFEKNGTEIRAMASTTKIMTCILALEKSIGDTKVTFSENAQRQPKVHLGAKAGEVFQLNDLLYSLMLESHNDTAVAIAETISGSVEAFTGAMNKKAKEIGCTNTYFITPNGLDASDEKGVHSTTAVDLARIMSYCVLKSPQKETFLKITQTSNHSFSDSTGKRTYSCTNHNAFLTMMGEAISGKTGFTSDAGYCYVGTVQSEGRTFSVALLACGWPNHKNYKWKDMRKLSEYALANYHYKNLNEFPITDDIMVHQGVPKSEMLFAQAKVTTEVIGKREEYFLMREDETIDIRVIQKSELTAPVKKGEQVGEVVYLLNGESVATYPIVTAEEVRKKNFTWCFCKAWEMLLRCN